MMMLKRRRRGVITSMEEMMHNQMEEFLSAENKVKKWTELGLLAPSRIMAIICE